MPGSKSPFGYAKVFFDILAEIELVEPEVIEVKMPKSPLHARALFNNFRASWQHEAERRRKQKDIPGAQEATRKFHLLQRYSCSLGENGIVLKSKDTEEYSIVSSGRVDFMLMPIQHQQPIKAIEEESFASQQHAAEEAVKRALGISSEASRPVEAPIGKPEQISNDNLPSFTSSLTPPTEGE